MYGTGKPLVLLPGGVMATGMTGRSLAVLAKTRKVIADEVQGHGHTADIDRPLTYEQVADDTAALIKHLGLECADVFGFSSGGGIALQTAIRHPEVVRKLVVASSPCKSDGEYPEIRALVASFDPDAAMLSPMREAYLSTAPEPENCPRLCAKIRQSAAVDCDWTQDGAAIHAPTPIVVRAADTVLPSHPPWILCL